ncbi:MAG: hypothetical protein AAGK14_00145 [Verrucomicrobiota bacterium]
MSLIGYYKGLVAEFSLGASNSGCEVDWHIPRDFIASLDDELSNKKIICKGWKAKSPLCVTRDVSPANSLGGNLKKKGALKILVVPCESYFEENKTIYFARTTIEVAYIFIEGKERVQKLIYGAHYDYDVNSDGRAKQRHPLYHVHFTKELRNLKPYFENNGIVTTDYLDVSFVRLPTPHMCYSSILIGIAADMFSQTDFDNFLKYVKKSQKHRLRFKNVLFEQLNDRAQYTISSLSWY